MEFQVQIPAAPSPIYSRWRSWSFLFSCNLMWALQFTCVKLVQDQVGPVFTVWGPMTLATLMLYPLIRREAKDETASAHYRWRDAAPFLLLAVLGQFPAQVLTTWGTRQSLASNAALLSLTLPILTAVLAFLILRERMTRLRWISFALAIVGALMCSGIDFWSLDLGRSYLMGNLLILAGVLGSAFYNTYGKGVLRRYSPMQMLFFSYLAMFVLMTPLMLVTEGDVFTRIPYFTLRTWAGLVLLTVFHNYLSMVLFLKALKHLDANQAGLSNYLITFFGLPIAALWLGERLRLVAIVGGILVLGSTLLVTVWDRETQANGSEG